MNADEQRIQAARGYLMLGMWLEAAEELDNLPVAWRTRAEVLHMRIEIYMGGQHWESGRVLAESLAKRDPANPQWWVLWALCARRETSAADARDVLLKAAAYHSGEPLIHYNLACYHCLAGDIQTAMESLKRAFAMDPQLKKTALDDPDLDVIFGRLPEGFSSHPSPVQPESDP